VRFPGSRNPKFYFPVTRKATRVAASSEAASRWYALGLDEVIVDLEVHGTRALGEELGFVFGESVQLEAEHHQRLLERLQRSGVTVSTASAGGTVANSLNNYTHLSGEPAVLLGAIADHIRPGDLAYRYVSQTPRAMDLQHLLPVDGPVGTAITYVTPEGERSFGVAPGVAGDYPAQALPREVVENASVVLASLYCLRPATRPIAEATRAMMAMATEAGVPVAFGLGTAGLVEAMRDELKELLRDYVNIAAMNHEEAAALTGETDALLAAEQLLEWVDLVVVTEGKRGLTLGGWTDERVKRETRNGVQSGAIAEFNTYEFSRVLRRRDCEQPLKVYSHTHPYRGGPDRLANTNGAGDAAMAAVLHDVCANRYHRTSVPDSAKHATPLEFLTYSSLSRNAQYCNRVAYEVLRSASPRLDGPVGEDTDE